jgi:hypothetical protein
MAKLDEFRDLVDRFDDPEILNQGLSLVRDLIEINEMRNKISKLESSLTQEGRAIFYFFASSLDEDELIFAAERISGRLKRMTPTEKKE